jgi:transcriptional regulator with XRE-family HTH domain
MRELRIGAGLTRSTLAAGMGVSESKIARWERGQPPHPDLHDAAVVMRLLGHDFVANWYPAGGVLRDVAHARLIGDFLRLMPASVPRRLEAPIPLPGDLRAWDVLLSLGGIRTGVAAETRLRDWQALLRHEERKMRDSDVGRLLLVLRNTHANRRAVADAGAVLRETLPLDGRSILPALRRGIDPGRNGLLFL